MSTVLEPGTIEELEIDEGDLLPDEVLHFTNIRIFPKGICGAEDCGDHRIPDCPSAGAIVSDLGDIAFCPGCGIEICSPCRVLDAL